MKKYIKYPAIVFLAVIPLVLLFSCKDFLNPEQELDISEDQLFDDWYEFRSTEMGLYGLQQELVEQLMILGELRGDLLTVTDNADADMIEIYNFNVSKTNKYASPANLFKLISASNNFIRILQREHPEVADPDSPVTNYDKLYGETLCMRAWAYFSAVKIYGKVPYIPESLTTIDEIENFVNSSGTYIDSIDISYSVDGYYNDTVYNTPIALEKQLYDTRMIIDVFTNELENKVKAVGVNHYIDNGDNSWEVSIWNTYAWHALLGQMYLTEGDYVKAIKHYNQIVFNSSDNYRYQIDDAFSYGNWKNIFNNIDSREHIYTLWFNKANLQQNQFQSFFEPLSPHKYMLKPTRECILKWESIWDDYTIVEDATNPNKTELGFMGMPGDFYRGFGVSYNYLRNGTPLAPIEAFAMMYYRALGDDRTSKSIMEDVDTVVWKYSINKERYDQDANFVIYRAAGILLDMAEIYTYWAYDQNGIIRTFTTNALNIVNNGSNFDINASRKQLGIRGRVGFGGTVDGIKVGNINYIHDPYTNEITGYLDLTNNLYGKQLYLEEQLLDERARELAFEGNRFYDLIRTAKRRNDPSFLAKKVSAKYPASQRDEIYNLLLNEDNWYIKYFE